MSMNMGFSVLSRFDDILANYFVDQLGLWFNTVRMNTDFTSPPIDTNETIDIIRQHVVMAGDPAKAAHVFLKLPYFTEFLKDKSKKQITEFTQHLKRYLHMFMDNAGFEISSTKRYTGNMEACIVATRDWTAGEQVKCCLGSIAALSKEEDAILKSENRDFSVMVSTRKKCSCLFLGPARFMNHDCEANCEFFISGHNAVTFSIVKNIARGEEMTVHYGTHYFGINNCECLCSTCERNQMGAFSPPTKENNSGLDYMGSVDETDTTKVKKEDEHSSIRRSSRKRKQVNYAEYNEPEKKQKTSNRATPELVYTQHTLQSSSPPSSMEYSDSPSKHDMYINNYLAAEGFRACEMDLSFICDNTSHPQNTQKQNTFFDVQYTVNADPLQFVDSLDAATELTYRNELELQKSTERVPGEFLLIASPPLPPSAYQSIPNQRVMQSEIQMSLDPHLYNTYPVTQQVDLYPSNAYSIHHPDIHHYSAGHPDIHPYSMDHPPSPYSISQTTNPYSTSQPDNHLTGHPIHQNPMSHPGSPSPHHYSATHPSNPHPVSYPSNPHPLSYPSNPHPVSYPSNPHPVSHPSNHPISHQSTNGNHVYPSNETLFLDDCCPIGNSPDIGRSPDNTLCNKCHRHKMIFGLFWPVRKIKECKPMKPTNPKASHRKRPIPLSKTGKGRVTKNKGSPIKSAVVAPKRVPNMAAVEEGVTELILRHDDAFSMDSFILPEQSEEETHLSWKFQ